jgi:hypothetical protein
MIGDVFAGFQFMMPFSSVDTVLYAGHTRIACIRAAWATTLPDQTITINTLFMEQRMLKFVLLQLRVIAITLVLAFCSFFFFSFSVGDKLYNDIWKQLGLTRQQADKDITASFMYGYLSYYNAKNFKSIATGNRAEVARELAAYAKLYMGSEAFKKEYAQMRADAKPEAPKPPKTREEIQKREFEKMQKSLAEMEKTVKAANADMKKALQPTLEMMRKQVKEYENPNSQIMDLLVKGEEWDHKSKQENYQQYMKKWQQDFPEDPNKLIKKRLQELLKLTADIDFKAELKEKYGKKVFVNPDYENKPTEWKQAFRAGKEATEAARAFAQQWLSEL